MSLIEAKDNYPRGMLYYKAGSLTDLTLLEELNVNRIHIWPMLDNPVRPSIPRQVIEESGARARWEAEIHQLHRRGIEVIASTSSGLFSRSVMREVGWDPEIYSAKNADGTPKNTDDLGRACYNNPHWIAELEKVALCFAEMGFDGCWFDVCGTVYQAYPEIYFCHCGYCKVKWRQHLKVRGLKEVPLPFPVQQLDRMDPMTREHMFWFWQNWAEWITRIRKRVGQDYPDFKFGHNMGVSEPVCFFLVEKGLYDFLDFEDISSVFPPYYPMIPSYLIGRALGEERLPVSLIQQPRHVDPQKLSPHQSATQRQIYLAEGYACLGTPNNWQGSRVDNRREYVSINRAFNSFVQQNEFLYREGESLATVAVVWSYRSQAITGASNLSFSGQHFYQMGTLLGTLHVPYDFLLAERSLNKETLTRYRTVILPSISVLSNDMIATLKDFVEGGGSLIFTGITGKYDEHFRRRETLASALIAGIKREENGRYEIGKGRLLVHKKKTEHEIWEADFRQAEQHSRTVPLSPPPQAIAADFHWAFRETLPLKIRAAATTAVIPWKQANRVVVHLVNYNLWEDPEMNKVSVDKGVHISLRLPAGRELSSTNLVTPEDESRLLKSSRAHGWVSIETDLDYYGIVVFGLQ